MQHQLVFPQPPDHVEVDAGDDVAQRHRRVFGEIGRAEHAKFFAGPKREDDSALEVGRAVQARRVACPFEARSGPARLTSTIRARVRAPVPFRKHCRPRRNEFCFPRPRAPSRRSRHSRDDRSARRRERYSSCVPRGRGCEQDAEHIAIVLADVFHGGGQRHRHVRKNKAAFRVRVFLVELRLHGFQIPARRGKHRRNDIGRDRCGNNSRTAAGRIRGKRRQFTGVGRIRSGDKKNRFRAPLAREHRLVAQAGVAIEFLPALRIHFLRHIAQRENNFVRDVQTGVGIVAFASFARHGEAVADENHFARNRAVAGKRERRKSCLRRETHDTSWATPESN